jgi:CBS domain containing-hemolysin-like protein
MCFAVAVVVFFKPYTGTSPLLSLGGILLVVIAASLIIILVAELMVRTVIRLNPSGILDAILIPLVVFFVLFLPISWFLLKIGQLLQFLFLKDSDVSAPGVLMSAVFDQWLIQDHSSFEEKHRENRELKIFRKVLRFSRVRVRDCMIPRTEIEAIDINAGLEALKKEFISTGFSKILIYRDVVDNIIGYISSKELFKHPSSIKEKLTDISFVPETTPASKMLHDFMQYHRSVAIVVDEYGGVSGMITLEDVMEEIFGEIEDEHDTDDWVEKTINHNEFVFSGRLEIEHLNSKYNLKFRESEEYDTLAGFILFHYSTLPKPNEIIKVTQYLFRILKVSQTRIELVYLKVLE